MRKFYSLVVMVVVLFSSLKTNAQNAGNYTFAHTTNGSFISTTGGTTLVAASQDDGVSGLFTMSFPFFFMGNWYNNYSVSSNGALVLGNTIISGSLYGTTFPASGQQIIAPYLGDLNTHSTGLVRSILSGSAPNRILVIEWNNMGINWGSTSADATYQARLYEATGVIEFVYGAMAVNGTSTGGGGQTVKIGIANTNTANNVFSVNQTSYATDNTSATAITNTNSATGTITSLNGTVNGSRHVFTFTPNYTFNIFSTGNTTWTAPASCVSTVTADVWGGGGGGGSNANFGGGGNGGGAGGGGGYARGSHTVASSTNYYYNVGTGGAGGPGSSATIPTAGTSSWFNANAGTNSAPGTSTAGTLATGGGVGLNNSVVTPSNGATAASCLGNLLTAGGGAGGAGQATSGGGGGASGGSGGNGAAGVAGAASNIAGSGGVAYGGGNGGNGGGVVAAALGGSSPGGGGGGSDDVATEAGGTGGSGRVVIWYANASLPVVTNFTASAAAACTGSGSVVTVNSTTLATGSYIVTYNVSGTNTVSSTTAAMSFTAGAPGSGTFTTAALNTAGVSSNAVNITSIAPSSSPSCGSALSVTTANFTTNQTPQVSVISASAASACSGAGSVVTVSSSTLASGTYTVTYNVSGTNTVSSTTASMTFTAGSPGTGTFTTSVLGTAGSANVVNITAIATATCSSTVSISTAAFGSKTTTWTAGAGTTDWNTGTNWSCGFIPTATDNVVIASAAFQPVISVAAVSNSITLNSGTSLTINSTYNAAGNWTNNGATVSGTGTVTLSGATATVAGTTTTTFPNMTSTGAAVNLGINTTVTGDMSVTAGAFSVSSSSVSYTLTVGGNYTQSGGQTNVSAGANNSAINITGTLGISGGFFVLVNSSSATGAAVTVSGAGGTTISGTGELYMDNAGTSSTCFLQTTSFTSNGTGNGSTSRSVDFGAGTTVNHSQIRISGNFAHSSTNIFYTTSSSQVGSIIFNGTGTQTFNYTGTTSSYTSYTINSAAIVQLQNNFTMAASGSPSSNFVVNGTLDAQTFTLGGSNFSETFALNAAGTLITANTGGVTGTILTSTLSSSTANNASNYTFNGGSSQTTNFGINPCTMNNLTINNSSGGVTDNSVTIINGVLSLNGILTNSSVNTITVNNTATTAITGGSTTSFVSGPLSWKLPASLSSSAAVYNFPVGKGGTYYPYSLTTLTTGGTAPVITVEAFNTGVTGGGDCSTVNSLSSTEYWQASFTGTYSNGSVSLTRQTALGTFDRIARSAALAGTYASLAGTVSGTSINNSNLTGAALGYFTMGSSAAPSTPAISSLGTSSGCAGSSLTINGTNLGGAVAANVTIGGVAVTSISSNTGTVLVVIPAAGSSGTVSVTNCGGTGTSAGTYTVNTPTTQATIGSYTNNTGSGITVNWTRGNGITGVIVVARLTATANANPADGTSYVANTAFGTLGSVTGTGNYVVYNGTGTTVNVTSLALNTSYTFTVYEYGGTCYMTPGSSSAVTTAGFLWTGGTSIDWFTPGNWNANAIPTATDNITIGTGTFQPVVSGSAAVCNSITLNNTTTLAVNSTLGVSGNWTNNGSTVSGTGTVTLSGTCSIAGTASTSFPNLTITGTATQGINTTVSLNYSQTAGTYTVTPAAAPYSLTVGGTFIQSAGIFNVTGSSATAGATVTVSGATSIFSINMEPNSSNTASTVLFQVNNNVTFTGTGTGSNGSFDWMQGGSSGTLYPITFGITGNMTWSGTGSPYTSGSGSANGFTFNGAGTIAAPQTLSYAGSTSGSFIGHQYIVNSGTVLKLLTNIAQSTSTAPYNHFIVNGTLDAQTFVISGGTTGGSTASGFYLNSGALLRTSKTTGVTGTITDAKVSYDNAASYEFYATANQTTSLSNTTMKNLTISNTGGAVSLTAAVTANGNVLINSGGGSLDVTATNYAMIVGTNWTNNGAFNGRAGTVTFNNSGATGNQLIAGTTTFYNLTCSAASTTYDFGTVTTTIANALSVAAGSMSGNTSTVIFTGASGSVSGAAAKNFYDLTINSGASISNATGGNIFVNHNYANGGTFTQAAGINFNMNASGGASQSMSGAGTSTFGNFIIPNNSVVGAGAHSFSVGGTNFAVTSASAQFNGGTGTVTMSGAVVIGTSAGAINFNNLTISGSLSDAINKNFAVDGDFANTGTYTKGTETVTFTKATGTQTINIGASSLSSLNHSGAGVLRLLTNNLTLSGTLTMGSGSGNIDARTNNKTLYISNTTPAAVSYAGGLVDGNLKRAVSTLSTDYLWPVGFTTNYTPVTYNFTVLTAGDINIIATSGDQANLSTSAMDAAKNVNAYWTVTPTTAASTNYSGSFGYPSGLNDDVSVVAGYVHGKYNAGWTYSTVSGTPTSTLFSFTSASGLAGDHAVGKCKTVTTSAPGSNQSICSTTTSASLSANAPGSLETGAWTVASGPSLNASQFNSTTSNITTFTPDGGAGTYVLTWTITSAAPCLVSSANNVSIIVTPAPNATISYGPTSYCGSGTVLPTIGGTAGLTGGVYSSTAGLNFVSTSTGEINLATSTAGTYTVTYNYAAAGGCSAYSSTASITIASPGTWLGVNTSWTNSANWCGGIPTASTDIIIPNLGPAGIYPIISSGVTAIAHDININATNAYVNVTGTGVFQLNGSITGTGTFNLSDGTLELAGSGAMADGSRILNGFVKNLYVSANSSLAATSPVKVTGNVSFLTSSNTLTTNDNLALVSNAGGTANITDITHNGAALLSGNSISGKVSVERYITTPRKWQFLSSMATAGTSQTIKSAWMENATPGSHTTPASNGYGVWITDATSTGGGFDSVSFTPSMKYWNAAAQTYAGVTNPTTTNIHAQDAYMTYIRGDRYATGSNSISNNTTLRSLGTVGQGIQADITVPAFANTIATGNPYPSAVDLSKVFGPTSGGTIINLMIWDPKLAGSESLGGFQYIRWTVGVANGFQVITPGGGSFPAAGAYMNTLESGQGFFVQSAATGDIVMEFNEPAKTPTGTQTFFTANNPQSVNGYLSLQNAATYTVVDGLNVTFGAYNSAANHDDALKLSNTNENISVKTDNILMAGELRGDISTVAPDTIHINMANLRFRNYQWRFDMSNMDAPARTGFLIDQFTHTETPLDLTGTNTYDFTAAGGASAAADRFMIVFRPAAVVPVTITSIAANRVEAGVEIRWKAENEINIAHYEVERSANGTAFSTIISNVLPTNNAGGSAAYIKLDARPLSSESYYRIRSVSVNGLVQYSAIVKVGPLTKDQSITLYPNPISDRNMNLRFANKAAGTYELQLLDRSGRTVYNGKITVSSLNETRTVTLPGTLPAGAYPLVIRSEKGDTEKKELLVQ